MQWNSGEMNELDYSWRGIAGAHDSAFFGEWKIKNLYNSSASPLLNSYPYLLFKCSLSLLHLESP